MLNTGPCGQHTPSGELLASLPSSSSLPSTTTLAFFKSCLLRLIKTAPYAASLREEVKNTDCCLKASLLIPETKQKKKRKVQLFKSDPALTCSSGFSVFTNTHLFKAALDQHSSDQFSGKYLSNQNDSLGERRHRTLEGL